MDLAKFALLSCFHWRKQAQKQDRPKAGASGFVMSFSRHTCKQPGLNAKVWNGPPQIMLREQMKCQQKCVPRTFTAPGVVQMNKQT